MLPPHPPSFLTAGEFKPAAAPVGPRSAESRGLRISTGPESLSLYSSGEPDTLPHQTTTRGEPERRAPGEGGFLCTDRHTALFLCTDGHRAVCLSVQRNRALFLCTDGHTALSLCTDGHTALFLCTDGHTALSLCTDGHTALSLCTDGHTALSLCTDGHTALSLCREEQGPVPLY
ncbi:unnamed protein product [Gadus morhua 'NCC']